MPSVSTPLTPTSRCAEGVTRTRIGGCLAVTAFDLISAMIVETSNDRASLDLHGR